MNLNIEPFLHWFGYSRRERRSTFILFIILIIAILLRFIVPRKDIELKDISGLLASGNNENDSLLTSTRDTSAHYKFDPNSVSFDTLTSLGLSEKQARTIISYRNKGGRFRQPSDIKNIYGIDEPASARIIPFINIEKRKGQYGYLQSGGVGYQKKRERIDINKADSAMLVKLPGLGPVLSSRIIKYRRLLGGFVSLEQLKEVYGLHESAYILLQERVFADTSGLTKININKSNIKELLKHPYLDRYDIQAIMKFKEIEGRISGISELVENKVLSADKANRISPYLKF